MSELKSGHHPRLVVLAFLPFCWYDSGGSIVKGALGGADGLRAEAAFPGRAAAAGRPARGGRRDRQPGHRRGGGRLARRRSPRRLASSSGRALFLLLPLWLLVRMALNAIDGMLAREFAQKSRLGAYLNELGDVVSDAALYAAVRAGRAVRRRSASAASSCWRSLSEFAGALGPMIGAARRYDGPMGKSDRAVVFGALGLWLGLGGTLPEWLGWADAADRRALGADDRQPGARRARRGGRAQASRAAADRDSWPSEPSMRPVEEKTFRTHDGVELFYRYWPARSATPRGAVVLFHRGHEHAGRMAHLADELDLPDFAFFAWDARGHGRSPGERGYSPSLATSVRDVQDFVDHIAATYGIAVEDIAVVAQSVGAVLVAAWAHDYAPTDPLPGAGLAGLQGQALRAVRPHAA